MAHLKGAALDIVINPNDNTEYFDLLDASDKSPEVWGFVQINDGTWDRRAAIQELLQLLQEDARFIARGGRPYGFLHELITARFRNTAGRLLLRMIVAAKPTIAGMHGEISGDYLAYSLAYGARVATSETTFYFDNSETGIPAAPGMTLLMPRYIGIGRTMSLIHRGATIGAEEALSMGLVSEVVGSPEELVERCKTTIPLSSPSQRYLETFHRKQMMPRESEAKAAIDDYIDAMARWILEFRLSR